MKSFYAQLINPAGAVNGDGTFVPTNTRFYLPEMAEEFVARYGEDLLHVLLKAKKADTGSYHGINWIKE